MAKTAQKKSLRFHATFTQAIFATDVAVGMESWKFISFPPLPAGKEVVGAKTRLGIKPNTSPETLISCMCKFGVNDDMYTHLNEYEVSPFTGWTIACGCIHAPGPYLTFEVQLPQDDGNLLAWQLGQKIDGNKMKLEEERQRSMLKGCKNETKLFEEVVNMNLTAEKHFKRDGFA